MTDLPLSKQLKLIRYGLPVLRLFQLTALALSIQFYLSGFKPDNAHPAEMASAMDTLNQRFSNCILQLKQANAEQSIQSTTAGNSGQDTDQTESSKQRFRNSQGTQWVFSSEEKKWFKQP